MQPTKEWFSEWFNSPYYHVLYKNRDDKEAEFFLTNLIQFLELTPNHKVVDLACGKGRHSIFLNQQGLMVTGVDLSGNSIDEAKKFENSRLQFKVGDLRQLPFKNEFDIALNLFTSFGYFDCEQTNLLVLKQINQALQPNGKLLIDFFNVHQVLKNLVAKEVKTIDGIDFNITKTVKNQLIIKTISFYHKQQQYTFTEKVQILDLADFTSLFNQSGFTLTHVFGNYNLNHFDAESSERLILLATKHA